jgi:hypothetical protein
MKDIVEIQQITAIRTISLPLELATLVLHLLQVRLAVQSMEG